ncbi:MAG: anion permease [Proteobacteria bacterium]|nr:anion permease [Pseudomonadota bacterium]
MDPLNIDLQVLKSGIESSLQSGSFALLLLAIAFACFFEFINGFHDTANAVATVIYTRSLRPWPAVVWSGVCNFLGVFIGGISVAMGIVKLLPINLLASSNSTVSLIMVFSMLASSVIWNFGTWFLGLPASSSHALIGGIIGVGVGNAIWEGMPISSGVNWGKAGDVGLSLLVSPLLGFAISAIGYLVLKKTLNRPALYRTPPANEKPPLGIRLALITTSTGVSFAHGSNDGQKGVGLVMLILIALLPAQFALNPSATPERIANAMHAATAIQDELVIVPGTNLGRNTSIGVLIPDAHAGAARPDFTKASTLAAGIKHDLEGVHSLSELQDQERFSLRSRILALDSELGKIEKTGVNLSKLKESRKLLSSLIEYAPFWVIVMIAFSLGIGTMIGWKRIVVTLGEKIGKTHLTYAQGAVSELVAMSMIGISALIGLPVSTTHCLSSGIAGSMVAAGSGVRSGTVRNILLAWVLTLPLTVAMSAGFFIAFRALFAH